MQPTPPHRTHRIVFAMVALALASAHGPIAAQDYATSQAKAISRICGEFSGHDRNADGALEVNRLGLLGSPVMARAPKRGSAMVIVESRLLIPLHGAADLPPVIQAHLRDLAEAGLDAFAVEADLYAGQRHQDGRTLLAVRDFLRAVKHMTPDLRGVTLVGSFPEAYLVRKYNWLQHQPITLNAGTEREKVFNEPVHIIRSRAECVAGTADVILADLDGRWERLYHEESADLPFVVAVYENESPEGGPTTDCEFGSDRYEDFFYLNDGYYNLEELPDGRLNVEVLPTQDRECSLNDLRRHNPMGRPDIAVSRINPRGIALKPRDNVRGTSGEGLLDAAGRPQTVTFASEADVPGWMTIWEPDPVAERRLLSEYFERNHRFRIGEFADQLLPASISTEFGSHMPEFRQASWRWRTFQAPGYDLSGHGETTTLDAVSWLKLPATLRAFKAHSDPWGSTFPQVDSAEALVEAVGGTAWSWVKDGATLRPGLDNSRHKLDFPVYRSLYENGALPDGANLFINTGCESTMPPGARNAPYSATSYAEWQGAAAQLFYADGLALVGRSKVFYDEPREFAQLLGEGKTWGDAWMHYYRRESDAATAEDVGGGIGRKRAQFWGILGDWSLRLTDGLGPDGRAEEEGWTSLFNGQDLSGWTVNCIPADATKKFITVAQGTIDINSLGEPEHDYVWLLTEREYADFELRLRLQAFRDSPGNSGIQVRSRYDDEAGWLDGPQIDINPPGPWRTGMIWDETRGNQRWLYPPVPTGEWVDEAMAPPELTFHYADDDVAWNELTIHAMGTQLSAQLNGLEIMSWNGSGVLNDEVHSERRVGLRGHIALQLHTGDELHIRYRDIEIREL